MRLYLHAFEIDNAGFTVRPSTTSCLSTLSREEDEIIPAAVSLRATRDLPKSLFSTFAGCGHIPHEEYPQAFLNTLLPFLVRIRAAP